MERKFNALMKRINKAEKYMDSPYYDKLEGQELEDAIKEREKFIPELQELMKEASKCFNKLKIASQLGK